ncbi:MAG: serine hydrolase domain-containing protein [Planctomycetaceae bacterium]
MDSIRDVLPRTADLIAADFAAGQHKGFQLYVSLKGEVLADAASGEAAPGVPMEPETLVCWLSSGKPLTAMAIGLLWHRSLLSLDDPVARHLPEFGRNGKGGITIRHLLAHTAGLPNVESGYPQATWEESIAAVCSAPMEDGWIVGKTAGYHTASSWFMLGEVIQRVSGRPFVEFVRNEICVPAEMADVAFALTEGQAASYGDRVGWTWRRSGKTLEALDWHQPPRLTRASPGSSARGPIHGLGRFYENLLAAFDGRESPFPAETVAAMTTPQRIGEFDRTFRHVVDFGLGFLVDSNRYGVDTVPYGFGRHCSPRTFGHGGSQSSIGFADPAHGLAVAWAANAMIGEPRHQVRNREINTAIYEDLRLA